MCDPRAWPTGLRVTHPHRGQGEAVRAELAAAAQVLRPRTVPLAEHGSPVYVRKQIVHNTHVIDDLAGRGAVFVDELDEVPEGCLVIFSAHGVPPSVRAHARERSHRVVDATCPLVSKVHAEARRRARRHRGADRASRPRGGDRHRGPPRVAVRGGLADRLPRPRADAGPGRVHRDAPEQRGRAADAGDARDRRTAGESISAAGTSAPAASWDNDLHSYRKEEDEQHTGINLINVLRARDELGAAEAVERAYALRDRVMSRFLRLREEVAARPVSGALRTYLAGLCRAIRGDTDWALRVPRYHGYTGPGQDPHWADAPSDPCPDPVPIPAIAWWWDSNLGES